MNILIVQGPNLNLDTVDPPTIEVFLSKQYESEEDEVTSILSAVCLDSMSGHPLTIFTDALDRLVNHLTE